MNYITPELLQDGSAYVAEANKAAVFTMPIAKGDYKPIEIDKKFLGRGEALEAALDHDIRTPMLMLYGTSGMLLARQDFKASSDYKILLEDIYSEAEKLRDIITPPSTYDRFMAYRTGKGVLSIAPIFMNELYEFVHVTGREVPLPDLDLFGANKGIVSIDELLQFLSYYDSNVQYSDRIRSNINTVDDKLIYLKKKALQLKRLLEKEDSEMPYYDILRDISKDVLLAVCKLENYMSPRDILITDVIKTEASALNTRVSVTSGHSFLRQPASADQRLAIANLAKNGAKYAVSTDADKAPYLNISADSNGRRLVRIDNLYERGRILPGTGNGLPIAETLLEPDGYIRVYRNERPGRLLGKWRSEIHIPLQ